MPECLASLSLLTIFRRLRCQAVVSSMKMRKRWCVPAMETRFAPVSLSCSDIRTLNDGRSGGEMKVRSIHGGNRSHRVALLKCFIRPSDSDATSVS
jgi:hypothetical protein